MKKYNLSIDGYYATYSIAYAVRGLWYQFQEARKINKIPAERVIDITFEAGVTFRLFRQDIEDLISDFIGWRKYFNFLVKKRLKAIDKLEEFVLRYVTEELKHERENLFGGFIE